MLLLHLSVSARIALHANILGRFANIHLRPFKCFDILIASKHSLSFPCKRRRMSVNETASGPGPQDLGKQREAVRGGNSRGRGGESAGRGRGGRGGRGGGSAKPGGRPKDSPEVRISKTLSGILRHRGQNEGLAMRPDGYVRVAELVSFTGVFPQSPWR